MAQRTFVVSQLHEHHIHCEYTIRMNSQRLTLISFVVLLVVVGALAVWPRLTGADKADLNLAVQPVMGDVGADAQVVIFFDFLCPHCATFSENFTPLIERDFVRTGKASVYFVNYPVVDPVGSRNLARLGECVYRQSNDAFLAVERAMMRSQNELRNMNRAIQIAKEYGGDHLDHALLDSCYQNNETLAAVQEDVKAGNQLGVRGTPAVFVNGESVSLDMIAIGAAIEAAQQ